MKKHIKKRMSILLAMFTLIFASMNVFAYGLISLNGSNTVDINKEYKLYITPSYEITTYSAIRFDLKYDTDAVYFTGLVEDAIPENIEPNIKKYTVRNNYVYITQTTEGSMNVGIVYQNPTNIYLRFVAKNKLTETYFVVINAESENGVKTGIDAKVVLVRNVMDLNADRIVDVKDLSIFIKERKNPNTHYNLDFNDDTVVDNKDYEMIMKKIFHNQ